MTTETQGWDSRLNDADADTDATNPSRRYDLEQERLLQDVLVAVRNELPFIQPDRLTFISHLGQGSSFEVAKELFSPPEGMPYFTAVKRIIVRRNNYDGGAWDDTRAEQPLAFRCLVNVMREIRVLTHPKLRSHGCLVSAIGWGWTAKPWIATRPYLVMDYSDRASLARFASQCVITLAERRQLALDVAMGIRALHDCNIVHGDVKPANVLIYDFPHKAANNDRDFIAKLAGFGSALFEQDFASQDEYYLGTPKYNAPEICGRRRDSVEQHHNQLSEFEKFKAADCYSFGLLLWETFNGGNSFVEPSWLEPGEDAKEDAVLDLAFKFLNRLSTPSGHSENEAKMSAVHAKGWPYSNPTRSQMANYVNNYPQFRGQLDDFATTLEADLSEALQRTLSLCLRDEILQRDQIHDIVKTLSAEIGDRVPLGGNSTRRIGPPDHQPWNPKPNANQSIENHGIRLSPNAGSRLMVLPAPKRRETVVLTPQAYRYGYEDMFMAALKTQPPWYNQCEAATLIERELETETSPERKAQAHLQLALMFQIGYGIAPDSLGALRHLEAARENKVARAIFSRVRTALQLDEQGQEQTAPGAVDDVTCRNPAIFLGSALWRSEPENTNNSEDQTLNLGPISVASFRVLEILVKRGRFEPHELSEALTMACRDGLLDVAMLLAKHCTALSAINTDIPNLLHWLIMFNPDEAAELLRHLVSGPDGADQGDRLQGMRSLLASGHDQTTVLLPHRCMELYGTPLHWAVTAGYADIVTAFVSLGADVNARTQWMQTDQEEPDWSHTGHRTLQFARYMAHGRGHRAALQETIDVLVLRGLDINAVDSLGQTPLFVAVKNIDLEPYILEELLRAGAVGGTECEAREGNLVSSAVIGCAQRRLSAYKIPLLVSHVRDINACGPGDGSFNALHLCAILDAAPAAEALLQVPGIDADVETDRGDTAMSLAALKGPLGVLAALIRKGADLGRGETLAGAVSARQLGAIMMLIAAGSGVTFMSLGAEYNILHKAAAIDENRPSIVRKLLAKCQELCAQDAVNGFSGASWTPLHDAAYFGDVDGVMALLEAGADPTRHKLPSNFTYGGTPRELAIKIRESMKSGKLDFHPRVRAEQDHSELYSLNKLRRVETRFMDYITEIIDMLRRAEIELPQAALTAPHGNPPSYYSSTTRTTHVSENISENNPPSSPSSRPTDVSNTNSAMMGTIRAITANPVASERDAATILAWFSSRTLGSSVLGEDEGFG
ncbi:hypothetical protein B0T26DRAFT_680607 [Lasiosphaeria miniovina]|uniref:Protein kinase domain-containing protein n=1 Tax=Lasiosphaeria miniovina TaxID=1954250 RepID=A0AA40A0P0_9PEZI|nr:uncharacterized protein B0T26DRAFT_680607 [Lasiosphaeria miniovina]KAK0707025.1 hypothetical protein B0T26DRAFT_680607 [Lasiosphaeria miniovina]